MRITILSCILFITCGCSSLNKEVGDYVKDALAKSVERSIDEKFASRNLSLSEIKSVVDLNKDGTLGTKEVLALVKDLSKDYAALETKKIIDSRISQLEETVVHSDQLDSKSKETFNWIIMTALGLVSTYLGKQIVSAKKDGKRDERIALLEKALQKDLDGDGKIGNSNGTS
jgi:hypothetical protein